MLLSTYTNVQLSTLEKVGDFISLKETHFVHFFPLKIKYLMNDIICILISKSLKNVLYIDNEM